MMLNLGCGPCPVRGAVNIDMVALPGVDIVHNLDDTPWPVADQAFTKVQAIQVFEHVHDPVGFMRESWRVLKPGGVLYITVPHWQSENSYTDPTHVRHCTERTWDYWCVGAPLNTQFGAGYAGECVFEKRRVERYGDDIQVELVRL